MITLKVIGAALRGALKGFPVVNAVIEAVRNNRVKKAVTDIVVDAVAPEGSNSATENGLPHSWVSITFQILTTAVILYAFFTKQITPEAVIDMLKNILGGV